MLSAPAQTADRLSAQTLWRRAMLAAAVAVFAILWVGGVASQWLGRENPHQGSLASLFLLLAGVIVLLGVRTRRGAASLVAVASMGFVVEVIGAHTGIPFGRYAYTGVLQPQLLGVPLVMGFAWMALVAFACDTTRRLRLSPRPAAVFAALLTTATDLVIDPLAANRFGYWTWAHEGAYYGIPFSNFVGWFITSLIACRIIMLRPQPNFWADFVGTAIILFFTLIALANSLLLVALIGFLLCVVRLSTAMRQKLSHHTKY
jgi:putative membrane protein